MAILGNAAGTTARAYGHFFPRTRVDGVEIDGELTEVGRRYFDLRGAATCTCTRPTRGRSCAARTGGYDVIVVDAYRQPYIPFYLATKEFFALVRDRLAPGGAVVVNVGHPEDSDALEKTLTATMRSVFPTVAARPERGRQHDPRWAAARRLGAAAGAARAGAPAGAAPDRRGHRRAARRPGCAAARSTPTTARRSSG